MRILFVSTVMASQTHGPSRKLMLLRDALAQRPEVELRVITEDPDPRYPSDYVISVRYPRRLEPGSKLLRAWRYWREAERVYRTWPYEFLVFNDAPQALFAAYATRAPGVKLVAMLNDDDNVDRGFRQNETRKKWLWRSAVRTMERAVAKRAHRVVVCSRYLAGVVQPGYGLVAPPAVLYPALDLSEWVEVRASRAPGAPTVLFVKSDPIRGGVLDLLAALRLDDLGCEIGRVLLAGFDPGRYPGVVALAETLACEVVFCGHATRDQLHELIGESHIGVVPSRHEAYGITAREFLQCGLHTVVSRAGGLPEACEGSEVHYFEPGDINSLRDALRHSIQKHASGRGGRSADLRYDHIAMAADFLDILQNTRSTT